MLQQGEVRGHGKNAKLECIRREMAGPHTDQALWPKFVDPNEAESEHYKVYEQTLTQFRRMEIDEIK